MIKQQLAAIKSDIETELTHIGQANRHVRLIAVSKTQPMQAVVEAYALGVRDFGENFMQELCDKAAIASQQNLQIQWHFLGHLQRNKINKFLAINPWPILHSLDREELMQALAQRVAAAPDAIAPLQVLVQVNIGRESQKSGVFPENTRAFVEKALTYKQLRVLGLMAIPPEDEDPTPFFAAMRGLLQEIQVLTGGENIKELSLGMSQDFALALPFGATMVRVGRLLFGDRKPQGALP